MKRARLLAGAVTLAVLASGAVAAATRQPPDSVDFVTDDRGRALLLHGFNTASSAKGAPDALPELTEADIDQEYRDMGTNFVRFLIQWRAVEPQPGVYDTKYLDKVAERVSWYARRGYHVMLDMHQDLWGSGITPTAVAGNGAPTWATYLDGLPVSQDQSTWETYYLEPGVIRAFDNFWNTTGRHPELMEHYAGAWRAVAQRFANEPAVIGYDLMNEPWGGSLQSAAFESGPLAALYRACVASIRTVDQDSWIFLEPQAVGVNWGLPTALPAIDDPRGGDPRIGLAPHLYPLPLDLGESYTGGAKEWIDRTVGWWRENTLRAADRIGGPVILGEFGLDMTSPTSTALVQHVLDMSDEMGMGRAYWSRDEGAWGPYTDKGEPGPLVAVMNRAYPRAVGGVPSRISAGERTLTVTFEANGSGPTEIYLPADEYPNGGRVTGGTGSSWDAERRVLTVETAAAGRVDLVVTPA